MGQVAGQPYLTGRVKNTLLSGAHMLRAGVLGLRKWRTMGQYFAFGSVYGNLCKEARAPLTDELTLFAVASTTSGLGVAKHLYTDYLNHLRGLGRTDFYLYTDLTVHLWLLREAGHASGF